MDTKRLLLLSFLVCSPAIHASSIYKCVTDSGRTSFQQRPCDSGDETLIKAEPSKPAQKSDNKLMPIKLSSQAEHEQRQLIIGQLKDPESAMLRKVVYYQRQAQGDILICGQINAKNGFGGYNGFRDFVLIDGKLSIAGKDDLHATFVEMMCSLPKIESAEITGDDHGAD